MLAYIFYPLYKKLLEKVKKPSLIALIICLLVIIIIIVPSVFFVKALVKESYVLYLVGKQRLATGLFQNCTNQFCQTIHNLGQNPDFSFQVQQVLKFITDWIIQKGSNFLVSVPKLGLSLFVTFFALFYFLRDGEKFMGQLNSFLFMGERKYQYIISRLKEIIHGVIYGYLIVALLQGTLGALGFYLVGIPSPIFWGMLMAILALIPALGTGLVWLPASVILFLDGSFQNSNVIMLKALGFFLYSFFVVGGIDNLLKPKLIGEKAKVHPMLITVGVFGGLLLFGPVGVIAGPLLLSLTSVFIDAHLLEKL